MRKIIIFVSIILISLFTILIFNSNNNIDAKDKKNKDNNIKIEKNITKEKEVEKIKVDIKGMVINPGVYEIEKSSRVIDIINLAGGLIEGADTDSINLSKIVSDEDVIIIYSNDDYNKIKEEYEKKIDYCHSDDNDSCVEDVVSINNKDDNANNRSSIININEASIDELTTLPSIGEAKAKKIIEYRQINGEFNSIEEIKNISGIGDNIFEKIKDYIKV